MLATICGIVASANAQVSLTGVYNESFDSLGTSNVNSAFSSTIGAQSVIPNLTTWQGAKIAGSGTAATNFIADDGSSNSGSLRSLGNSGATDRALGALASGTNAFAFGVEIVNNTGSALESMTIVLTQENWRTSTTSLNTLVFGWSTNSTSSTFLSDAGFNASIGLDLVGPAPVTTNTAINGNDPLNQIGRTATLSFGPTGLANGASVFIRWQDRDDTGNDAAIAIDNLGITAQPVPEPATMAILGLGAAALIRRRRK